MLRVRLEARRHEIEQLTLTRANAISDLTEADPRYRSGVIAAAAVAFEYGLEVIEIGERHTSAPPPLLLAQARMAARSDIGLDTVLRRYFAGYTLFGDMVVEEADEADVQSDALKRLLRDLAIVFDRLMAAISEEHSRELMDRPPSVEQRRLQRVEQLLAGEPVDSSEFSYDFGGFHIGIVGRGCGIEAFLRDVVTTVDRRSLAVRRDEATIWVWLGGNRPFEMETLTSAIMLSLPKEVTISVGEQGRGPSGWRSTHRQARAALPTASAACRQFVRYRDVALVASILQDDLLSSSLREIYLEPLRRGRSSTLCETLRAYFTAERNTSSAAAALGISRQAVTKRLRAVEEALGRPIGACGLELEAALRLEEVCAQEGEGNEGPE